MRRKSVTFILGCSLFALPQMAQGQEADAAGDAARPTPIAEILRDVPLVDGHNDLVIHYIDWDTGDFLSPDAYDIAAPVSGQSDIPRMRQGLLGGGIFTIWTPDDEQPEAGLEASIGLFRDLARRNPGDLAVVTSPDELLAAHAAGKIGIILGLEGGNPVEGDLDRLAWMRDRGVSEMGLVWSTNGLGTAGRGETGGGLTDKGRAVVREMNRLGLIVDISHAAGGTVMDVLATSSVPVIDSHSYSLKFTGGDGAVTDMRMKAVAAKGGLIMPMFMPEVIIPAYMAWRSQAEAEFTRVAKELHGEDAASFVYFMPWPDDVAAAMDRWFAANPPPASTLSDIADVFDHIRSVVGIDHIGIGSDFDGMGFHPTARHPALPDVAALPLLLAELQRRGWSDEDLRKLAGGNFIRVWREIRAGAGEGVVDRAGGPGGS